MNMASLRNRLTAQKIIFLLFYHVLDLQTPRWPKQCGHGLRFRSLSSIMLFHEFAFTTYSSPKLFQHPLLRKLELQKETVSPLMTFDVGCAYLKASRRYLLSWKRQNYRRRMMHLFIIHRTFSLLANYKITSNFGQSHEPSQFIRRCLEYQLVHGTLNDDQFSQVHPSFPSGLWSLTFLSSRTLISLMKFHETAAEKLKQTNPY